MINPMKNKIIFYSIKIFGLCSLYFLTARIGLSLDAVKGFATLVWPPTGISLAALLLFGTQWWPGIALGAFLANLSIGAPPAVAFFICVGNTLEAVAGAFLLKNILGFRNTFDTLKNSVGFIFAAGILSTLISSSIGVASLYFGGIVAPTELQATWWAWWIGDMMGNLIFAPLFLSWSRFPNASKHARWTAEFLAMTVAIAIAGNVIFGGYFIPSRLEYFFYPYFIYPILIWASIRFEQYGSTTSTFLISLLAVWHTMHGHSFWGSETLSGNLIHIQIFMGITAVTTLILASIIKERNAAGQALQKANDNLESQITKRTEELENLNKNLKIEIAQRKLIEKSLRDSERLYHYLFDKTPLPMWVFDLETLAFLAVNEASVRHYGYTKEEFLCMTIGRIHMLEEIPVLLNYFKTWDIKELNNIAVKQRKKDGGMIDVEITMHNIDFENRPARLVLANDITKRKQIEDVINTSLHEKEVLLKEIHHRVKNNLQMISSLINLQTKYVTHRPTLEVLKDCQARIKSISYVHEKLYQSSDLSKINFAQYSESLSHYLFHSYAANSKDILLKINSEDVDLNIDIAIPCGLILNELVTNALKHAFPNGKKGMITVDLAKENQDKLVLKIKDTGIGFPKERSMNKPESLGLQLVNTLTEQIDGTIESHTNGGTEFKITFPFHHSIRTENKISKSREVS